jgi:O-acetyl-ADP-ribose deacetylase (regulator of RNase III)
MIRYVKGDVLETAADIVAHGCNCVGGFGAGVAGQIARKYPLAAHYYLDKFDNEGWHLGEVQFVPVEQSLLYTRWIANCATQKDIGTDKVQADYYAIETCMRRVKEFAKSHDLTVAVPKIGAGLAGGDWDRIERILEEVFSDYNVVVYYLE